MTIHFRPKYLAHKSCTIKSTSEKRLLKVHASNDLLCWWLVFSRILFITYLISFQQVFIWNLRCIFAVYIFLVLSCSHSVWVFFSLFWFSFSSFPFYFFRKLFFHFDIYFLCFMFFFCISSFSLHWIVTCLWAALLARVFYSQHSKTTTKKGMRTKQMQLRWKAWPTNTALHRWVAANDSMFFHHCRILFAYCSVFISYYFASVLFAY